MVGGLSTVEQSKIAFRRYGGNVKTVTVRHQLYNQAQKQLFEANVFV